MSPDTAEFEGWFRAHQAAVRRYVYRRVAPDAVDDVVADTFLTAWRRRAEVVGDPLPWLLAVARRVCANQIRGTGRRERLLRRIAQEPVPLQSAAGDPDPQLRTALRSLRDSDREALMLVAWDGLSHADAAVVLGCSTSAFTVRLHRARKRLARALAQAGDEPGPAHSHPVPDGSDGIEGVIARDSA